jgi:peroxiredoxin
MAPERPAVAALAGIFLMGAIFVTQNACLGRQAPDFSLPEAYYGSEVSLSSYRGHKVLLVFWTTSCGICRRELPLLNNMAPGLMKKGISVVAIHLGPGDVRDYLRTNSIDLLSLVDSDGVVGQAYHVSGVPKLFLIGEEGAVERSRTGMADEKTLREWGGA